MKTFHTVLCNISQYNALAVGDGTENLGQASRQVLPVAVSRNVDGILSSSSYHLSPFPFSSISSYIYNR